MTVAEILEAANEARPDLIEKTAKAIFVLEHQAPEYAEDLKAEIAGVVGNTTEKIASVDAGTLGRAVMVGVGGALGAGLAAAVATDLYDAAKRGLTKGTNYRRIMMANPELARTVDRGELKKSFDILHRYAPEFTADPHLGAQILKSMSETPESRVSLVQNLIQSQKMMRESKEKQFRPSSMGVSFKPDDFRD